MSLADIADKWDALAEELLRTSKSYRSNCNQARKSGYVGRASAFMAAAAELREALKDAEPTE